MKKYKYIGTEEQLKENGFEIIYSRNYGNSLFALREAFEANNIFVLLYANNYGDDKGYMSDNYQNTKFDITPYIQDLIALSLVVEV